jgi:hypothetical protein
MADYSNMPLQGICPKCSSKLKETEHKFDVIWATRQLACTNETCGFAATETWKLTWWKDERKTN